MIKLKRVYDPSDKDDGYRILVDRLWPRGLTKERAKVDLWLKDIAPSTELRKWFNHDVDKWNEFEKRYRKELEDKKNQILRLKNLKKQNKQLTLLYGARDREHNEAVVLLKMLL